MVCRTGLNENGSRTTTLARCVTGGSPNDACGSHTDGSGARGFSFPSVDGLCFDRSHLHVAPRHFSRSVESPPDQRKRKRGFYFPSMVAGARPCAGVRLDRQLHFWHWFLLDSETARRDEAGLRSSLGVLGDVDNRSLGALAGQHLFDPVASAASAICRARTRSIPDFLQDGFAASAQGFREAWT